MIKLRTVMGDGDGSARRKDGEGVLLADLSSVLQNVLGLHAREGWGGASVLVDDGERVRRQRVEGAARVVEQLEGLIAGVDEGGRQLEVAYAVNGLWA